MSLRPVDRESAPREEVHSSFHLFHSFLLRLSHEQTVLQAEETDEGAGACIEFFASEAQFGEEGTDEREASPIDLLERFGDHGVVRCPGSHREFEPAKIVLGDDRYELNESIARSGGGSTDRFDDQCVGQFPCCPNTRPSLNPGNSNPITVTSIAVDRS